LRPCRDLEPHIANLRLDVLTTRLQALHADVAAVNPDTACALSVARVFNNLLAEAREALPDDPIVATIGSIRAAEDNTTSLVNNGTVRVLSGQLLSALQGKPAP
jgi:hypothetical protein